MSELQDYVRRHMGKSITSEGVGTWHLFGLKCSAIEDAADAARIIAGQMFNIHIVCLQLIDKGYSMPFRLTKDGDA